MEWLNFSPFAYQFTPGDVMNIDLPLCLMTVKLSLQV